MVGERIRDDEVLVSLDWLFCTSMAVFAVSSLCFYWVALYREILIREQEGGDIEGVNVGKTSSCR